MNRTSAIAFGVGIAAVALVVGGMLFMQRGARIGLTGQMLKVRTATLGDNSTIAVIDCRLVNPSDVLFMVRDIKVVMEENDGKEYEGQAVSESDAKRLFDAVPLLGQRFNDALFIKESIPAQSSVDRMVAARFEAPESRIQGRKRFLIRISEMARQESEIPEK